MKKPCIRKAHFAVCTNPESQEVRAWHHRRLLVFRRKHCRSVHGFELARALDPARGQSP